MPAVHKQSLSILYIAYPLLTVSESSAGGAEQVLLTLEREIEALGHRTMVAASAGSRVSGRLLATGEPVRGIDGYEERESEHTGRILAYLRQNPCEFDLIHDKSGSFFRHAERCPVPVLATLHLPRNFYRHDWFETAPPNLFCNCVSQSQARTFGDIANLLGVVQNGICVPERPGRMSKAASVLWVGRICEEKAPHLAIAAARLAGVPITLAGALYPFSYHQQYFHREIEPHITGLPWQGETPVEFVEAPDLTTKNRLLAQASALLLTSTVEETSSLVAMEAMAMGTPVIAFRRGAVPEIVADGETGYLVNSLAEMAQAIKQATNLSPDACRNRVARFFRAERMARDYEALYEEILERSARPSETMRFAS